MRAVAPFADIPTDRALSPADADRLNADAAQGGHALVEHLRTRAFALEQMLDLDTADAMRSVATVLPHAPSPVAYGRRALIGAITGGLLALDELGLSLAALAHAGDEDALTLVRRFEHIARAAA